MKQPMPSNAHPKACYCTTYQRWSKLYTRARKELVKQNWSNAVCVYLEASDVAENMLELAHKKSLDCYLRTHLEFIFALRKSAFSIEVPSVVAFTQHRLERYLTLHQSKRPLVSLMLPIRDMAYAPMSEIERWMNVLVALDEQATVSHVH